MSSTANHGRHGRPWQRIRQQVLKRDPYCKIRGPKCTGISTTVDHIVPLSIAPHRAHDLTNLRGACTACNCSGGARLTNAKRRASNGAHRAHKRAMVSRQSRTATSRTATVVCRFHRGCGSVHSRPWGRSCRGSEQDPCDDACRSDPRPSWCALTYMTDGA